MIPGVYPLGFPIALAEVEDAGAPNPNQLVFQAETGRVFLYEISAFDRTVTGSWIATLGDLPTLGAIPSGADVNPDLTLRFSDVGYISRPADSLQSVPFDGKVDTGLRISRSLPATPEASRRVNLDVGSFSLINSDSELDTAVRNYTIDGRQVRVLLGLNTYSYDQFWPVCTLSAVSWNNRLTKVDVTVRDRGYELEIPMQPDRYDGTGGYNGGLDLAGRPRPLCFGKVLNISPPMINASNLIYQVHSRAIQAVDAVYDRGASITAGADYADYAALIAATVGGGTYATCLALGLIRLGSSPSGLVTADVRGDAAGGYIDTTGPIARRVIKDFGQMTEADLNGYLWDAFATNVTGTIGWWQGTDPIDVSDALDKLFGHCAAWWGADNNGIFECGRIAEPNASIAMLEVLEADPIDLEILDPLPGTFPPRFRQRVGYQRNWTQQQETDLAGAVTAARRQFLAEEYRVSEASDLYVQTAYRLATDPPMLESLFNDKADADALAALLLALYKKSRQTVRAPLDLNGLKAKLGYTVLVNHPRLNGGAATPMLCMDSAIVADSRKTELVLWG